MCHPAAGTYTITITPSAGNASSCQTAMALGSGSMFTYPFDAAAPSQCTCSGSTQTCTFTGIPCGPGCTYTQTNTLDWTSSGYTGTETLVQNDGGTCNYTVSAM